MSERHEWLGRLVTDAAARLAAGPPWLVVAAAPRRPAALEFGAASADELRRWIARHVADWPAPMAIGSEPPERHADRLAFTPPRHPGGPPGVYHCELHSDGSALCALQVGTLRAGPPDGGEVWAIGEGAVAWITIATLRLAAAFADKAAVTGEAVVEAAVIRSGDAIRAAPMEVWNHAGGVYGPAGERRLAEAGPVRRTVGLEACLSPGLAAAARPLVVELLGGFGLAGSRHIDPAGVLRRGHFTGHDERIRAWADAIGIPSRP